jgi:hypothetical protein
VDLRLEIPQEFLSQPAQRSGFIALAAFLGSFLFIRTSARLIRSPRVSWWPGSVTTQGGLHLHHLVWGIVLLLVSGFLEFALAPPSPWVEVLAGLFGVGAGLTLDEFALWVHLEDVYWAEEGRASLDAVVVAALVAGLVVLGLAPFELHRQNGAVATIVLVVAIDLLLCALAILKGKPILGLTGVFIPVVSLAAALRLASPSSPWARWRYPSDGRKMARAQARYQRIRARRLRVRNAIAGAPSQPAS